MSFQAHEHLDTITNALEGIKLEREAIRRDRRLNPEFILSNIQNYQGLIANRKAHLEEHGYTITITNGVLAWTAPEEETDGE